MRAVRPVVTEPVGGEDAANAGVGGMMATAVSVNGETVKALGRRSGRREAALATPVVPPNPAPLHLVFRASTVTTAPEGGWSGRLQAVTADWT